tara:strand:- start:277 stop:501 length:225 start_codon:yes stop_codon:yes gene_type:complete
MSLFISRSVLERQMKTSTITDSQISTNLPESIAAHLKQMGILPVQVEEDKSYNWKHDLKYFRRDVLDENNEPLF